MSDILAPPGSMGLNFALNKPALQSSTSEWSKSLIPDEDASGANNGHISAEIGFHTGLEQNPWWQVDLKEDIILNKILIFNSKNLADRLKNFSLLKSLDGESFSVIYRKLDDTVFDELPYVIELGRQVLARFVRIQLDGCNYLHFNECQIFGERPDQTSRDAVLADEARVKRERLAVPNGRIGRIVDIDGFSVFADTVNYAPAILSALDCGLYEGRERDLVRRIVLSSDRILEVGTAIGMVSMTAASIVGPTNVITFDANPDIAADARFNFARNQLSAIHSKVGVLRNRSSVVASGESADFYVSKAFWASRLNRSKDDHDIIKTVRVPVFCLEDEIERFSASVLICDIEGGEVDLLMEADLAGIRAIIMETHYWSAGESASDGMIRWLILEGFSLHLGHSGNHVVVLRR